MRAARPIACIGRADAARVETSLSPWTPNDQSCCPRPGPRTGVPTPASAKGDVGSPLEPIDWGGPGPRYARREDRARQAAKPMNDNQHHAFEARP